MQGIPPTEKAARFDHQLMLPEAADIGCKAHTAMREVEKHNPRLDGGLPKTFHVPLGALSRRGVATRMRTAIQEI